MTDTSESDDEEVLADQQLEEITIETLQGIWRHTNGCLVTVRDGGVVFSSGDRFSLTEVGSTVDMDGWRPVLTKSTANRISWNKSGEDFKIVWSFERDLEDDDAAEEVDAGNIRTGKRRRNKVDYRALYEQQKKKRAMKKAMRSRGETVSDDDVLDQVADDDSDGDTPNDEQRAKKSATEGDGRETVAGLKGELDQSEMIDASTAMKVFEKLKKVRMDLTTLKDTKIGIVVNKYRKHADPTVKTTAKALVSAWKTLLTA